MQTLVQSIIGLNLNKSQSKVVLECFRVSCPVDNVLIHHNNSVLICQNGNLLQSAAGSNIHFCINFFLLLSIMNVCLKLVETKWPGVGHQSRFLQPYSTASFGDDTCEITNKIELHHVLFKKCPKL